jgi:AcrR family transcriptional regulator
LTSSPLRPRRADARRNYTRLLSAADDAFVRDGVGASLEGIAKTAGVAVGTLYSHFPTRDDLLARLISDRMQRLADLGRELASTSDADEALLQWLNEFGAGAATYQGLPESVIRTLRDSDSALFSSCEAMEHTCAALLRRAQTLGRTRTDLAATDLLAITAALAGAATAHGRTTGQFLEVLATGLHGR